jgi:nitroreductase
MIMSNVVIDLLNKRYSAREFQSKKIKHNTINYILNAGKMAPSGGNEQPWKFGIIDEKYMINKISEYTCGQEGINTAPLIIVLCTYKSKVKAAKELQPKKFSEKEKMILDIDNELFQVLNMEEHQTKIAGALMMLAALEKGIYTTWVSKFQSNKISELLSLAGNYSVSELLVMGYPKEINSLQPKKKLSDLTFFNRYLKNEEIFLMKINDIQPSQLYISKIKLDYALDALQSTGFDKRRPLPIININDKEVLSDGHSRTLAALMEGYEEIPVYYDKDELNMQMYETCVHWCLEQGITTIADLKNRIVNEKEYEKLWVKRCQKMHEKINGE